MADTTKKIIRGVVNSRGFTITSPITQWDYGWQFVPEIEDLRVWILYAKKDLFG